MKKAMSCVELLATVVDDVRTMLCAADIEITVHSGMSGIDSRQAARQSFRICSLSYVRTAQNVVAVIRGDWTWDIVVNGVYSS